MREMRFSVGFGARFELGNRVPITLGVGFPLNAKHKDDEQKFFFAMGGQF